MHVHALRIGSARAWSVPARSILHACPGLHCAARQAYDEFWVRIDTFGDDTEKVLSKKIVEIRAVVDQTAAEQAALAAEHLGAYPGIPGLAVGRQALGWQGSVAGNLTMQIEKNLHACRVLSESGKRVNCAAWRDCNAVCLRAT